MKNVTGELQETFGKAVGRKSIHALCGGDEFMLTVMGTICECLLELLNSDRLSLSVLKHLGTLLSLEYKAKQEKVQLVRQELKAHLENLPDLTKLPDLGGGLAPLPSAGDLFASAHRS
ncbi:Regulation of nuclear pre-mRNA domain-containing protein 1B [Acropora cervicornis]|uniref:Regulation of nuclear pre-mRNA domain-containing protein 1B n=1 Tax=Acropora cervicornis TaxID=6130 RepID=A0AAD9QGD3_ACRCE|nr:Regulation of nuclear pre-mRNA domain-containing protein 1B [Acropora cervicornis]